jgi:hypothetical protein
MQNNWFSGTFRRITALNVAILFVVATFAPSIVSILTSAKVAAAPTSNIVLNEVFPSPTSGSEWVELYNNEPLPINLSGWTITDAVSYSQTLSGIIPAHGYLVFNVSQFNNTGDTITLSDGAGYSNIVVYPAVANNKSYARVTDGDSVFEIRETANVTKNDTNDLAVVSGELNAENFNTVDANYKGVSVGFNAKNFGTVTAVKVELERADGSTVTKHGNQGVFDIISGQTTAQQLTAPFVIQEGAFTEASDVVYWDPAPALWNASTAPVKATIYVTDENGTEVVENTNFSQGAPSWPTYLSLLPTTSLTKTITGNTATGENQPGWLFNRDTNTSTPYEFNADEQSIGVGSLNVLPIGASPSDKFVAENFVLSPVAEINQISYDFKIGAGGSTSDADEFYMNVYANFGISSTTKFYDCRYNVVPVSGSTGSFTTVTFDPSHTYPVATSGSSPHACPSSPAAMDAVSSGSTIRAFALNVGDSSANDLGLDGYLDNVVVDKIGQVTTYDFEPDTTAPAKPQITGIFKGHNSNQASLLECGGFTSMTEIRIDWEDNAEDDLDYYWIGIAGNPKHQKVYAGSHYDGNMTPGQPEYYYTVIAVDTSGNESPISESCALTLDQMPPEVEITAPANTSVVKGKTTISGKVVDDNPSHYYLVVKDATGEVVSGPGVVYLDDVADYEWDTTKLPNGTYYIHLSARDKAGNKDTVDLSVDNVEVSVNNSAESADGENENNGPGGRGSAGDGRVTVTVLSSTTDQNIQTDDDQVLGTSTDDQASDDEKEVLAENSDQNSPTDGEPQEEQSKAPEESSAWWWILGLVLLATIIYLIFRRKKNATNQE